MFHPLAYDETCRTYLARFSGTLTDQDQADFAKVAKALRQLHGPVAGLQDYRDVEMLAITTNQTVQRGYVPQIMVGQKRAVVADGVVFGMMRMFATYQEARGELPPVIVRTLAEAYDVLCIMPADFKPEPFIPPVFDHLVD